MRVQGFRAAKVAAACLISLGAAGCNGDDRSEASSARPSTVQTSVAAGTIAMNIVTNAHVEHGRLTGIAVQPASSVGGAPFCTRGTGTDGPGNPDIGHIARTFTCSDGTILMGMEIQQPSGKSGTWRIVSGTGAYAGWTGSGSIRITILDDATHVAEEVLEGTVDR